MRSAKLSKLSGSVGLAVVLAVSSVAVPNRGFAQDASQLDTARETVEQTARTETQGQGGGGGAGWLGLLGLAGLIGLAGLRGRHHHEQVHTVDRGAKHVDTTRQQRRAS